MTQANAVLGLLAETSIHAGTGQLLGAVDLPIEREAHTRWPCVYGSGVKGALRALAFHRGLKSLDVVFGPDVTSASEHAGALAVSDARLLLLPVRALDAAFRWVTCPAVLERFARDLRRAAAGASDFSIPQIERNNALVATDTVNDQVFLEEFRLPVQQAEIGDLLAAIGGLIADASTREHLPSRFTLVDDVFFADLVRSAAIPVTAHVKLKYDTKTVDGGALRYEESLPPETLLYTVLSASESRKPRKEGESHLDAAQVLSEVTEGLFGQRPYLQIGGNETVGMGWCHVASLEGGAS